MRFQALWMRFRAVGRGLRTGRNYVTLMGVLAGIYALTFCHLFLATYGTAMTAVSALALAAGLGLELGWKPARPKSNRAALLRRHGVLHLAIVIGVFALPTLMSASLTVAGKVPLEVMAAPGRALLFQCLVAIVILSPAVYWIAVMPGHLSLLIRPSNSAADASAGENERAAIPAPHFATVAARQAVPAAVSGGQRSHNGELRQGQVASRQTAPSRTDLRFAGSSERDPWAILGVRRMQSWWQSFREKRRTRKGSDTILPRFLFGVTIGLLLDIFLIAPALGVHGAALMASALSTGLFLGAIALSTSRRLSADVLAGRTETTSVADRAQPANSPARRRLDAVTSWMAVCVVGSVSAILLQMVNQLAATAAYLVYVQWTAVLLGLAFGLKRGLRTGTARQRDGLIIGCCTVTVAAALTVLLFGRLIDLSLWMNAFVVDPWMMMASRGLLLIVVMLPVGYGWGRIATGATSPARMTDSTQPARTDFPVLQAFAFVAGYLLSRWDLMSRWEISGVLVGLLWLLSALAVVRWTAMNFGNRGSEQDAGDKAVRRWRPRLFAAGVLGVVIAVSVYHRAYNPVRSARQLFATNVFVARMNGLDGGLLSFLDEGRPVAAIDGHRGTLTLWRYRGTQLQLRENGVPKAIVSTNPNLCPHFSGEVLPAVLPLVMHERPHRVMILGLSGGVSVTTSLSFPVKSITCVEGDSQLLKTIREHVWTESKDDPDRDGRLQFVEMEPSLAVACAGSKYDVIISTPDQSALLHSTPYFTRGFYNRVSRQLSDDGIFCQRFHQVDYGPMPLQTVAKSLQAEFTHVAAIEIAAGEMALLATNSDRGLIRGNLVQRLSAPQVKVVLSRVGWDWAFPLNLTAFSNDGLKRFSEATPTTTNTAANGAFAFGLPQEVMRWAPKWQELLTMLAPHGTRLLEAENVKGDDPVLLRRLAELAGQRKLMTDYPDQWWAYRKAIKRQLREQPRTLVAKSAGEDLGNQVHPEDRHRMRYLKDLAEAAKHPRLDNIMKVAEYTEPYDPMITNFVHYEVASLYSRSQERDRQAELWHRLHAIYYSGAQDRSVRDVASAMTLLAEHPETLERPTQRWDHLNAMMQILKTRWETRGLNQPRSAQIVLNDIEECLAALNKSFAAMSDLHDSVGISAEDWGTRRKVVERGLVKPLREYRSQLLKHHLAERQQIKALLKRLEEGIEDPEPPDWNKDGNRPSPTTGSDFRPSAN